MRTNSTASATITAEPSPATFSGGAPLRLSGGLISKKLSWDRYSSKPRRDGFSGDSTLYLADATWKWAPNGNTKDGGLTLRSELFFDKRDGIYVQPNEVYADPEDPLTAPWIGDRRGAYLEAVYRLNRTWDIGYRYDRLWASAAAPFVSDADPAGESDAAVDDEQLAVRTVVES